MRAFIFLIIISLFSCGIFRTPEERAKRKIDKLIDKYPGISNTETTLKRDTFFSVDSIIRKEINIDTSFFYFRDSIYIIKEGKVSTEVQILERDKIRLRTIVQSDTIYFRDTLIRETIIRKEIIKPLEASFLDKYGILIILGSIFILGFYLYVKI